MCGDFHDGKPKYGLWVVDSIDLKNQNNQY